ncbi:MAG: ABC transporter permease [Acidobacteriota bacterium]|nr:ABC transporter permease [Acidobacteriota bacterium]
MSGALAVLAALAALAAPVKWSLVAVIAAVVVSVRVWRFRRRRRGTIEGVPRVPDVAAVGKRTGRLSRNATWLVARREIVERLRARSFRVVTAIILLVVTAAIVIPVLTKSSSTPLRVGIVGTVSAGQRAAVAQAAKSIGSRATAVPEATAEEATAAVRAGKVDLAVLDGSSVLVDKPAPSTSSSATDRLARALAAYLGVDRAFGEAGLSPAQVARIAGAQPLPVRVLQPTSSKAEAARGTSVIGVILVFVMLSQYETWTLIGVMEEKASRVVEVLLATVRPLQLLGGKVLGIGTVALAQAAVILAFAFGLAEAVGSSLLQGSAPLTLLAGLFWLVIGYAFYCWVYAAAGSMAERQDQVQTLILPLTIPMIVGYVTALTAASAGNASAFVQVLAYLPPTAPFVMPIMVGLGAVSWWQFAASALVTVGATVAVARLASVVYRRAVLRTGGRVSLRDVLTAGG